MKSILRFTFFLIIHFLMLVEAKGQGWIWAKDAGGIKEDWSNGIATDLNGNVYVTGYFYSSTINFGGIALSNTDTSGTTSDAFLVKYNSNGVAIWARKIGSVGYEMGVSVTTDAANNVYTTGTYTSATLNIGSDTLTNIFSGWDDIFIAKYDSSGNIIWAKSAGGHAEDRPTCIKTDTHCNVYITGTFSSVLLNFDTLSLYKPTIYYDMFLAKYDSSGNILFAKMEGNKGASGNSLSIDGTGNIYVAGLYGGKTFTLGTSVLTNMDTSGSTSDIFLVKYNSSDSVVWAKSAGGKGEEHLNSLTLDTIGNIYITGYFYSSFVNFGGIILTNTDSPYVDMYLVKYNESGGVEWAKNPSGSIDEYAFSATVSTNGNIYVTGYFSSPSMSFGTDSLINPGGNNIFLLEYNQLGNVILATCNSSGGAIFAYSIANDVYGNIYISGMFGSVPIHFPTCTISSVGNQDVFVAKFNENTLNERLLIEERKSIIYPNPTNKLFTIELPVIGANTSISIIDLYGKVIESKEIISNNDRKIQFDLNNVASGTYLLKVIVDGSIYREKLVIW